jgi:hypothetical protein
LSNPTLLVTSVLLLNQDREKNLPAVTILLFVL